MSTDAQPLAPTTTAGQPRQDAPKRLPGLWIICVLLGLAGMFMLTMALSVTALGALIICALAAVPLALAAALWLRLRVGWWAAMVLLGIGLALGQAAGVAGGRPNVRWAALVCLVALVPAFYLWIRRRCFGPAAGPRPAILSAPGIGAVAVVLALGCGLLLLLTVDDARRSFAALEAQVPVPPEQENGYLLVEQMRAKWPLADDGQFNKVEEGLPRAGSAPSPEWLAQARALVQRYGDCLADARELVGKPHCVEVPQLHGMARTEDPRKWLTYTRALAHLLEVSAEVQAADHHWDQALSEADEMVELGVFVGNDSTSLIQTLVSLGITQMGLHELRKLAAAVPDATLLKPRLRPLLPEEEFRRDFDMSLAGEFQGMMEGFEALRTGGFGGLGEPANSHGDILGHQVRRMPLIKKNMTYNLLGGFLVPYLTHGDTYVAPPKPASDDAGSLGGLVRKVGMLHFARNPIGDILVTMVMPAIARYHQAAFGALAQARLTQVYLALRCYQLDKGRLPEELGDLAPEYLKAIPRDPFTGKPFGYEPGGQKPRIWSVGPDQVAGKAREEGGDDVVVELDFAAPSAAK